MYSELKNILQELEEIEIQEQDVEEHVQQMNVKGTGCVHCIGNDGNNKSGGAGVFAKDGFRLNKKVKEEVWRTGLCFH